MSEVESCRHQLFDLGLAPPEGEPIEFVVAEIDGAQSFDASEGLDGNEDGGSLLANVLLRGILRVPAAASDDKAKDTEILVLRHQLKVLRRKIDRPPLLPWDRVLLAAASRALPRDRWTSFFLAPQSLLRWHREPVRKKLDLRHCRSTGPAAA